jgi:phage regulator Rha-like protein
MILNKFTLTMFKVQDIKNFKELKERQFEINNWNNEWNSFTKIHYIK